MAMSKREAAELILAGRKAARRVGRDFVVDREKLGRFGGFSAHEMDEIEQTVQWVEASHDTLLSKLGA